MYRPSNSNYKSWTSPTGSHSAATYPSSSPGPTPGAPHLHTVSLPHPSSVPRYASPSGSQYDGPSNILSLNPLLSWTGIAPLHYNVTRDVQCIQLYQGCHPNMLYAPAVQPVCTVLVLSIPSLPWSSVEVRNDRGVSVYDVLVRLRDVLDRSISPAEMGALGVKRMDFLGQNVYFAGLSRSMDGMDRWVVHFVSRA